MKPSYYNGVKNFKSKMFAVFTAHFMSYSEAIFNEANANG